MEAIIFKEKDKKLEFNVLGYEFVKINEEDDDFDANWLMINIIYSDGKMSFDEKDSLILSFELKDLIDSIDRIIDGEDSGLIKKFMEPYLAFSITKIDEIFAVQIRYAYGPQTLKEVSICQKADIKDLKKMNEKFNNFYEKYPYRKTKKPYN